MLVALITGHCLIGRLAQRLNIRHFNYCRSCKNKEEESVRHLRYCNCPAWHAARFKYFGLLFLNDTDDLKDIRVSQINGFTL